MTAGPLVADLAELSQVAEGGIVSKPIVENEHHKIVLFTFAAGQELSEHTASVPAVMQILEGECEVTLGADHYNAQAGFWVYMQAKLPHSLLARTPVKMLLLMLSDVKETGQVE